MDPAGRRCIKVLLIVRTGGFPWAIRPTFQLRFVVSQPLRLRRTPEGEQFVVQFDLQTRLEAARAERRRQANVSFYDKAPATGTPAATSPEPLPTIDLRTLREMRGATGQPEPALSTPAWDGSPRASVALLLRQQANRQSEAVPTTNPVQEPCPACGGSVRLDLFDLVETLAHLTCLDCGLLFTARSPRA